MSRYIDADKLKEDLKESESILREIYNGLKFDDEKQICAGQITTFVECILRIKEAPTADVAEVKHGEWIEKDCITESNRGRTIHYVTNKCSVCGKWNGRHKSNYCPNCGAKMDK